VVRLYFLDVVNPRSRRGKRTKLKKPSKSPDSKTEDYPSPTVRPTTIQSHIIPSFFLPLIPPSSMAEPQPPTIHEGIDTEGPAPPTGTDARKAAAALSSLDARGDEDETAQSSTVKNIDQEALVNAISRLELTSGKATPGGEEQRKREAGRRKERERRAKIKVDAADVGLLVSPGGGGEGRVGVGADVSVDRRWRSWS
jgi:hypothetical protein